MELLIISKEANKIHISTDGLYSNYTVYDKDEKEIDGGVLIGKATGENTDKLISSVIAMTRGVTDFSEPYKTLKDEETMELIEELQGKDYQDMVSKTQDLEEELER